MTAELPHGQRTILFVSRTVPTNAELDELFADLVAQWKIQATTGLDEVYRILESERVDAIVVHLDIEGGGLTLLSAVYEAYPEMVRIGVCGPLDERNVLFTSDLAHQVVRTSAGSGDLAGAIARSLALRAELADPQLINVVGRLGRLPAVPSVYRRLQSELRSEEPSLPRVAGYVGQDPATTAKVMQLVNSAFMGLRYQVTSIGQAVGLLGLNTVSSLVLGTQLFTSFARGNDGALSIEQEWHKSMSTAIAAQAIAVFERRPKDESDAAYLAGLLHNAGRLVLAATFPAVFASADWSGLDDAGQGTLERSLFGAEHPAVGAYLLSLWGLPGSVVEAIAFQRNPRELGVARYTPLTAVHVARAVAHSGDDPGQLADWFDEEYLAALGMDDRVDLWLDELTRLAERRAG